MFRRPRGKPRIGSAFIAMLMLIVVAGIIASRLVPNVVTTSQRQSEKILRQRLARLRMAFTVERMASMTPKYSTDWSSRTLFLGYLNELVSRNLIPRIPSDPTIPSLRWGTTTAQIYWIPTKNYLASSSFEVLRLGETPWATGSQKIIATISQKLWVGKYDSSCDSFQNENRFGSAMETSGTALLIATP